MLALASKITVMQTARLGAGTTILTPQLQVIAATETLRI